MVVWPCFFRPTEVLNSLRKGKRRKKTKLHKFPSDLPLGSHLKVFLPLSSTKLGTNVGPLGHLKSKPQQADLLLLGHKNSCYSLVTNPLSDTALASTVFYSMGCISFQDLVSPNLPVLLLLFLFLVSLPRNNYQINWPDVKYQGFPSCISMPFCFWDRVSIGHPDGEEFAMWPRLLWTQQSSWELRLWMCTTTTGPLMVSLKV